MLGPIRSGFSDSVASILYRHQAPIAVIAIIVPAAIYVIQHLDDILERAIASNRPMLVRMALAGGGKLSKEKCEGLIREAFEKKDLDRIRLLCALPDSKDIIRIMGDGRFGFITLMQKWVNNHFNINVIIKHPGNAWGLVKATLFSLTFEWGCKEVGDYFIDHGLDPNHRDLDNFTPLHIAAKFGCLNSVKKLLDKGGNINARGNFGETPLCSALKARKNEVAEYLIDAGAEVQSMKSSGTVWENFGEDFGGYQPLLEAQGIEIVDVFGYSSPIHCAMKEEQDANGSVSIRVIEKLLEKGAAVNEQDEFRTPIDYALCGGSGYNLRNIQFLVERGGVCAGWSTLLVDSMYWDSQVATISWVRKLLELGADINTSTRSGIALHAALKCGKIEIGEFLLRNGAKVMARDRDGNIPFHHDLTFAASWLNALPDTSLFSFIQNRNMGGKVHPKMVLREKLYERDDHGKTLLHWAAEKGHIPILKILLRKGGDHTLADDSGMTCKDYLPALEIKKIFAGPLCDKIIVKLDITKLNVEELVDIELRNFSDEQLFQLDFSKFDVGTIDRLLLTIIDERIRALNPEMIGTNISRINPAVYTFLSNEQCRMIDIQDVIRTNRRSSFSPEQLKLMKNSSRFPMIE